MQTQNDRENAWKYEEQMNKALNKISVKNDEKKWIKTGFLTGFWEVEDENKV